MIQRYKLGYSNGNTSSFLLQNEEEDYLYNPLGTTATAGMPRVLKIAQLRWDFKLPHQGRRRYWVRGAVPMVTREGRTWRKEVWYWGQGFTTFQPWNIRASITPNYYFPLCHVEIHFVSLDPSLDEGMANYGPWRKECRNWELPTRVNLLAR